jgi:hypothetical protein
MIFNLSSGVSFQGSFSNSSNWINHLLIVSCNLSGSNDKISSLATSYGVPLIPTYERYSDKLFTKVSNFSF